MPYRIDGRTKPISDVPSWNNQPRKWGELFDLAERLEPGTATAVIFDDLEEAKRARNAVRDAVNMRHEKVIIRTRIEKLDNGSFNMWIIRLVTEE